MQAKKVYESSGLVRLDGTHFRCDSITHHRQNQAWVFRRGHRITVADEHGEGVITDLRFGNSKKKTYEARVLFSSRALRWYVLCVLWLA